MVARGGVQQFILEMEKLSQQDMVALYQLCETIALNREDCYMSLALGRNLVPVGDQEAIGSENSTTGQLLNNEWGTVIHIGPNVDLTCLNNANALLVVAF